MFSKMWQYLKETVSDFSDDNALSRGAALAFYTILSLGPLLVLCIAVAGFVFGEAAARGAIVDQLRGMMGKDSAELIQSMIASAGRHGTGFWPSILAVGTLVITSTSVFGELQAALNFIWKAEPNPTSIGALLKARAVGLGLVATLGFLLLVSLVISAGLTALGTFVTGMLPWAATAMQWTNALVSFVIISALFAAIYKILPDRKLDWRDVGVGAVGTAVLLTIGKAAIAYYIGAASVANSYGAAGTLIVVLLWIYYSCQIFLLGAEFTKVWAAHHGSREAFAAQKAADKAAQKASQKAGSPAPAAALAASPVAKRKIGWFDLAALASIVMSRASRSKR